MAENTGTEYSSQRRLFLQSLGLLGSSAVAGTAVARSQKDKDAEKDKNTEKNERAEIDRTFAELEDKHGRPTIDGRKSFANEMVTTGSNAPKNFANEMVTTSSNAPKSFAAGNAPENADELFSNKRYDVVNATKYAFEDGVKKTVAIGINPEGGLMVYLDGEYFRMSITDADRQSVDSSLEQLNSKMEEKIQTALQERYRSDEYWGVGR